MSVEHEAILAYLRGVFQGVYDEAMVQAHYRQHVEPEAAQPLVDLVLAGGRPTCLLDAGCGFGAFLRACALAGIRAVGVDVAERELQHAVGFVPVVRGSVLKLPFADGVFDVVTLWNLLEHVPDLDGTIREVARVLAPGGRLYAVCPNYAAFRREAHYQVPWVPLLPRSIALRYLRALGRNPGFLEDAIHYTTPWRVHRALRGCGLYPRDLREHKLDNPAAVRSARMAAVLRRVSQFGLTEIVRVVLRLGLAVPWRHSVAVWARKEA